MLMACETKRVIERRRSPCSPASSLEPRHRLGGLTSGFATAGVRACRWKTSHIRSSAEMSLVEGPSISSGVTSVPASGAGARARCPQSLFAR